jgi:hypothetical protein
MERHSHARTLPVVPTSLSWVSVDVEARLSSAEEAVCEDAPALVVAVRVVDLVQRPVKELIVVARQTRDRERSVQILDLVHGDAAGVSAYLFHRSADGRDP